MLELRFMFGHFKKCLVPSASWGVPQASSNKINFSMQVLSPEIRELTLNHPSNLNARKEKTEKVCQYILIWEEGQDLLTVEGCDPRLGVLPGIDLISSAVVKIVQAHWYSFIRGEYKGHIRVIDLMCRVIANGLVDWGSIPGRVIPKTQKMVLDAAFLITQHYKVRIKGKVEQSRELSSTLPYTLVQ